MWIVSDLKSSLKAGIDSALWEKHMWECVFLPVSFHLSGFSPRRKNLCAPLPFHSRRPWSQSSPRPDPLHFPLLCLSDSYLPCSTSPNVFFLFFSVFIYRRLQCSLLLKARRRIQKTGSALRFVSAVFFPPRLWTTSFSLSTHLFLYFVRRPRELRSTPSTLMWLCTSSCLRRRTTWNYSQWISVR